MKAPDAADQRSGAGRVWRDGDASPVTKSIVVQGQVRCEAALHKFEYVVESVSMFEEGSSYLSLSNPLSPKTMSQNSIVQ